MRRVFFIIVVWVFLLPSFGYSQRIVPFSITTKNDTLPFGIPHYKTNLEPSVSIVLSGGGARGVAQIGVMKALIDEKIPITNIIGTSMGSIVGGLISSGYDPDTLANVVMRTPWNELIFSPESDRNELFLDQKILRDKAFLTLRIEGYTPVLPTAINTGVRVSNFLTLLGINAPIKSNKSYDELRYNYRAVSTDLVSGKTIVIGEGPVAEAMRASSSVSLLLDPVVRDSLMLVDGGLVANIPASVAKEMNSDIIIISNCTSPLHNREALKLPWNIADQMISIPMQLVNEQQLKYGDVVITPNLDGITNNDFDKVYDLVDKGFFAGYKSALEIKTRINKFWASKLDEPYKQYSDLTFHSNDNNVKAYFIDKYSYLDTLTNLNLATDIAELYHHGEYKNIDVSITKNGSETIIDLNTTKNPIVKTISFNGITQISQRRVSRIFDELRNKPYNGLSLYNAIKKVISMYRIKGYSLAEPEVVNVDLEKGTITVDFIEGLIEEFRITGNVNTTSEYIKREIPISDGDIFNYKEVEEGLTNLRSTSLFKKLELDVQKQDGRFLITLHVHEKLSQVARFGLRIDNENQTQILADIREENLLGTVTELGFTIGFGARNRMFSLEHKANRIFNSYFTYKIKAFYESEDINDYEDIVTNSSSRFERVKTGEYYQSHLGGAVSVGTQVYKFGTLIMEGRFQRDRISNKIDYTEGIYTTNIASLKLGLNFDTQDKFPFPNTGAFLTSYYETAQTVLGGDNTFAKFYFDYYTYIPVNEVHNFRPRFVLGLADETLLLSQQFSFGGQKNFYGYRKHEFRGRQIMIGSLEYRLLLPFKLFFDTYFKFRYDLGSIWATKEEIRFKDLRHGIGGTLAIDTPVGPAEFSVGKSFLIRDVIEKSKISYGPMYFYFTIGYYY